MGLEEQIDEWICRGEGAKARSALFGLEKSGVDDLGLARFAALAVSVGAPELGLRILRRKVRGNGRELGTASDEERAEYARCLAKVGAREEALEILRGVDAEQVPRAKLYEAMACLSAWDQKAAIPLLEACLGASRLA